MFSGGMFLVGDAPLERPCTIPCVVSSIYLLMCLPLLPVMPRPLVTSWTRPRPLRSRARPQQPYITNTQPFSVMSRLLMACWA